MTLIPMLSALKGARRWVPGGSAARAGSRPSAGRSRRPTGRGVGRCSAMASSAWPGWWCGLARPRAVVGPVMRKASDLAMAPYAVPKRGYLRMLPARWRGRRRCWAGAALAFALTLAAGAAAGRGPDSAAGAGPLRDDRQAAARHAAARRPTRWCATCRCKHAGTRACAAVRRVRHRHAAGCQPDRERREHRQAVGGDGRWRQRAERR
jgi:hypothetical protein